METGWHTVWDLNTTGSPLNMGLRYTSRPLITVYNTVNPALTRSNFGLFPLDFLRIHLNTSLNTLARDRPPLCFERHYGQIATQHRTIPQPSRPLITVYKPRSHPLKLRIFPLRLFQQLRDRFWLKTNSILINPHLLLVHQPSTPTL